MSLRSIRQKPAKKSRSRCVKQTRFDREVCLNVEPLEEMDLLSGPGDEFGDTFEDAQAISISPVAPTAEVFGEIGIEGDVDMFSVVAPTSGTLQISQNAFDTLDCFLRVFDADGIELDFDDDSGPGTDSFLELAVGAGQVLFIQAGGFFDASVGEYQLSLVLDDFGETIGDAQSVLLNAEDAGHVFGVIEVGSDTDLFRVVSTFTGTMIIRQDDAASGLDSFLTVYDGDGAFLDSDDDGGEGLNSFLRLDVVTGQTLFVEAGSFSTSTGRYNLTLVQDDFGDSFATAELLFLDATGEAQISGEINRAVDVDMFVVQATEDGLLVIEQTAAPGSPVDSLLSVFDSFGILIGSNDGQPPDFLDARLELQVFAGDVVYIRAGTFDQAPGEYNVSVSLLTDQVGNTPATAQPLTLDPGGAAAVNGTLEVILDLDVYQVVATTNGLMTVRQEALPGSLVDSFLRVFGSEGQLLAENDDASTNTLDSFVEFQVTAGQVVFLQAGAFSPETGIGAYRLSVSTMTDEVGDTIETAQQLPLDASGAATIDGAVETSFDVDVYQIVPTTGGLITIGQIAPASGNLDSFLRVLDADGNVLAFNDDLSDDSLDSFVTVAVTAGQTLYVEAGAFSDSFGRYTLSVRTPAELVLAADAPTIVSGEVEFFGDADLYRIVAPGSGQLTITQVAPPGSGLDSLLAVFDQFGDLIATHDGDPPLFLDSHITLNVQAGQVLFVQAGAFFDFTGEYDLTFTLGAPTGDDFGDTIAEATDLDLGSVRQSSVDGVIEQARDVDVFRLVVDATGTLTIRQGADGSFLDSFLRVFDANGNLLLMTNGQPAAVDDTPGSLDSQVQINVTSGQELFIQAGAFGSSTGNYQLGVSLNGDGGEVTQLSLAAGGTASATGQIEVPFDEDVFQVIAPVTGVIRIQQNALNSSLDSLVRVFDAAGNQIAVDDDSGIGVNSELFLSVSAGQVFFIHAGGFLSSSGEYQLVVTAIDAMDDYGNTNELAHDVNLDAQGGGGVQGNLEIAGDRDVFRVTATVSGQITISLDATSGSTPDTFLRVFVGNQEFFNDDGGPGLNSLLVIPVVAGQTLFVSAGAFADSGTGRYELRFSTGQVATDDVPNEIGLALDLGTVAGSSLEVAGQIGPAGDVDMYRLEIAADGLLVLQQNMAAGSALDSFLTVFNASGAQIAANDDSGGSLNSRVQLAVRAGDVLFVRAGAYGSSVGGYRLTAQVQALAIDDHGDTLSTATALGSPESVVVAGEIGASGDRDFFQYVVTQTGQLTVTQNAAGGSVLDAYLRIFDTMGLQIAFDDDGGEGLNSRIQISVTAGQVLFLQAGGFGSSIGAYELALSFATVATTNDGFANELGTAEVLAFEQGVLVPQDAQAANFVIDAAGDVDFFQLDVTLDGLLTLTQAASGSTLDSFLRVFDASGRQIAANDDDGLTLNSRVTLDVKAGDRIFVQAGAFGQSVGRYNLAANLVRGDVSNQFNDSASQLVLGDSGTTTVDGSIDLPGDQDVFQFTAEQNTVLEIQQLRSDSPSSGNSLDSFLRVYDSAGRLIVANDDVSAANRDSRLLVFVAAGQQIFIQAGAFGATFGDYRLQLSAVQQDDVGNFIGTAGQMVLNGTNQAVINSAGDIDWFRFSSAESGRISIDLVLPGEGNAVFTATRVSMLDGVPERFARSDANGQLSFDVTAGQTYFIRVEGLAEGDYQLQTAFTPGETEAPKDDDLVRLGSSVLDAARTTFADGQTTEQITQAVIDAFLAELGEQGGSYLVIWLDPVDFTLTAVDGTGGAAFGATATDRVNELGNVFYSGNNVVEVLVIPNALSANSLALTGLGENVRGAATFVTAGQVTNTVSINIAQLERGDSRSFEVVRAGGGTVPVLDPRAVGGTLGGNPQLAASGATTLQGLLGAVQSLQAVVDVASIVALAMPFGTESLIDTFDAQALAVGQLVVARDGTQHVAFGLPEGLGSFRLAIVPTDEAATSGPLLESVQVFRSAAEERLLLQFKGELDPRLAAAAETYQLVWAGPNGEFGDADDQTLELKAGDVRYDAEKQQVVLRIKLPAGQYLLRIKPASPQAGNEPASNEGAALRAELDRLLASWPLGVSASPPTEIDTAEALLALNETQLDHWFASYSAADAASAANSALLGLGVGAGMLVSRRSGRVRGRNDRSRPRQPH